MLTNEHLAILTPRLPRVPQILCAPSLRHDMDELVRGVFPSGRIALVDDIDTASAMGDSIYRALKGAYEIDRIDCGKHPKAEMRLVDALRVKSRKSDLIIAVGSGTISDICKYASFLEKKPYIVFPTAASMNGYLSATASVSDQGYKASYAAHLPLAVLCDLSVIAAAPGRLSKSGLGDSLARATAQADWLMSHLLLGTPYDETPFQLTASHEAVLLDNARGIALKDAQSVQLLMQVLLLSGLGMTVAGGSHPASQAEHMLAHTVEMMGREATPTLHGEQIAVTTLLCSHIQRSLLDRPPTLRREMFPLDAMTMHFGKRIAEESARAYLAKQERINQSGLTNRGLRERWSSVSEKIAKVMLSPERILSILQAAQAPQRLEMLGWNEQDFALAATYAPFTRDRFTCLDVAAA